MSPRLARRSGEAAAIGLHLSRQNGDTAETGSSPPQEGLSS